MKLSEKHIGWYCTIEEIVKRVDAQLVTDGHRSRRGRKAVISRAYAVFYAVLKLELGIKTNRDFYNLMQDLLLREHGYVVSYQQFNETLQSITLYLFAGCTLISAFNKYRSKGLFAVDSTPIPVCEIGHEKRCKIGGMLAKKGRTGKGYFYGYKLHAIIDVRSMTIVSFKLTAGNISDIKALDDKMVKDLQGILTADKGYISKRRCQELFLLGLRLLTPNRKNMKQVPGTPDDIRVLKKRSSIESLWNTLKHHWQLINRYARSPLGFINQIFAAIFGYSLKKIGNQAPEMLNSPALIS